MFATVSAAVHDVGPGKSFAQPGDALAKARPGDRIVIHALPDGAAYPKVALFVRQSDLVIEAADGQRPIMDGSGFDYSGVGSTPRAIIQFNKGADRCLVRGLVLRNASNTSHNGAGVRINQANSVRIEDCEIHGNDMGIMSNGSVVEGTAADQRITRCHIHRNGAEEDPGYNHNLYLGGTSVTMTDCEISHALTGHNVKSRAHLNYIRACYVHDSTNREFDLVDDQTNTTVRGSHSVLVGNLIVKDPACRGNKGVIHFGQDGGHDHRGTLFLVNNTVVTPFISPVVFLDAPGAKVFYANNIFWDGGAGQRNQVLTEAPAKRGGKIANASGTRNWFSAGWSAVLQDGSQLDQANVIGSSKQASWFVDESKRDYRLGVQAKPLCGVGVPLSQLGLPDAPDGEVAFGIEYGGEKRKPAKRPDLGAFARR